MILPRADQYVWHPSYKFAQFRKININLIQLWAWFFDSQERHTIPYHLMAILGFTFLIPTWLLKTDWSYFNSEFWVTALWIIATLVYADLLYLSHFLVLHYFSPGYIYFFPFSCLQRNKQTKKNSTHQDAFCSLLALTSLQNCQGWACATEPISLAMVFDVFNKRSLHPEQPMS